MIQGWFAGTLNTSMAAQEKVEFSWMTDLRVNNSTYTERNTMNLQINLRFRTLWGSGEFLQSITGCDVTYHVFQYTVTQVNSIC